MQQDEMKGDKFGRKRRDCELLMLGAEAIRKATKLLDRIGDLVEAKSRVLDVTAARLEQELRKERNGCAETPCDDHCDSRGCKKERHHCDDADGDGLCC